MTIEQETTKEVRSIHISVDAWPPDIALEGKWSFIDILHVLGYAAEYIRFQGAEKAVENALGYQAQLKEALEAVKEE